MPLTVTSKTADIVLKSDIESEEEEEIAEEDDELEVSQSETAGSLKNIHVNLKPQLSEKVQGNLSKDPEHKPEGIQPQNNMEPLAEDTEPPFNLLQILQENRNLR